MTRPKILFVLTSVDKIPSTGKATGWYLPEVAHPYEVLASKTDITFASPKGGEAPLDPGSVEAFQDSSSVNFHKNHKDLYSNTKTLSSLSASSFDAIFFPGGHGPMFDLATDSHAQKLTADLWSAGKVVAAVCHGPAGLVNVKLPDGKYLLEGRKATGFSNDEEEASGLKDAMPFLLETEMKKRMGEGKYEKAGNWQEKVVVDGRLITGQNPASGKGVGEEIAKALGV
jgi:putative intracellular protease/amidase